MYNFLFSMKFKVILLGTVVTTACVIVRHSDSDINCIHYCNITSYSFCYICVCGCLYFSIQVHWPLH